jgi:hypothetical protein
MTPIRDIVPVILLSLRRRWLERQLSKRFDVELSRQLDAAIEEEEALREKEHEG